MTIILFLLNWSCIGWFSGHPSLIQLNLLFDSLFTRNQHLLKLSCLSLGFSNCLNMLSIFIYSWIFSGLFVGFLFFGLGVFCKFGLSFGLSHLLPWFLIREQLRSSSGNGGSMIGNLCISYLQLRLGCRTAWSSSCCGLCLLSS